MCSIPGWVGVRYGPWIHMSACFVASLTPSHAVTCKQHQFFDRQFGNQLGSRRWNFIAPLSKAEPGRNKVCTAVLIGALIFTFLKWTNLSIEWTLISARSISLDSTFKRGNGYQLTDKLNRNPDDLSLTDPSLGVTMLETIWNAQNIPFERGSDKTSLCLECIMFPHRDDSSPGQNVQDEKSRDGSVWDRQLGGIIEYFNQLIKSESDRLVDHLFKLFLGKWLERDTEFIQLILFRINERCHGRWTGCCAHW